MASIPLVALNARTPEQPDLLQKYGQLQALKGIQQRNALDQQQAALQQQEAPLRLQALQQQTQTGAVQLSQAQQGQADQQAFRAATQDPSLQGKTIGEIAEALAAKGQISAAGLAAAKNADLAHREAVQKLDTSKLANVKAAHDQTQQIYNSVMSLPDDQVAANWPSIVQQIGAIPGNEKIPLNPQQPMTKQQLQQFGPLLSMANGYLDQELARREAQAKAKTAEQTAEQGGSTDSAKFTSDYLKSHNLENTPANRQIAFKEYTKETKIEPAAVRAQVFLQQPQAVFNPETGQNEFTTKAKSIGQIAPSSADALAAKGGVQADVGSLKKLQSNFDSVSAFENTAGKNLDTFLQTAKGVVDSGSPLINSPLRRVSGQMAGSDKQAAFNAARTTALTEIAKVLNSSNASGVLSDSARHEVEGLIGPDATLKQIYSAAKILRTDMSNRHTAYQDQINEIKGRLKGQTASDSNTPPPDAKIRDYTQLGNK